MWQVRFERGREKGNVGCFFTVGDENVVSFGIDLLVSSLWMFCRRNQIWGGGGFQALLWYQENEMSIPFDADSDLNLGYMRAGR